MTKCALTPIRSATPELIGKLSAEFRKGRRTGPIVVHGAEAFVRTGHTKLAATDFARVWKLLVDLDARRRREQEPEVADKINRQLDQYRDKLADLKKQSKGDLDTATWMRVDVDIQTLIGQLRKTIAEVGLAALLREI